MSPSDNANPSLNLVAQCVASKCSPDQLVQYHFLRRRSRDATVFKAQYMELDMRLQELFMYVAPCNANGQTHSVVLSTLIRNAANLFELVSRWLYTQLGLPRAELKVKKFLELDRYTGVSTLSVVSYKLYDEFLDSEIYRPFGKVGLWDRVSPIQDDQIPSWWTANNKLKHSNDGLKQYGTLRNSIAAVSGCFVLLHRIFGTGYVWGIDVDGNGRIYSDVVSGIFDIEPSGGALPGN